MNSTPGGFGSYGPQGGPGMGPRPGIGVAPSRGFRLGTWFGIPVDLNFSVLILLLILVVNFGDAYDPLLGLLMGVGVLASIVGHEFGHALMARYYGIRTSGIALHFFGGVAQMDQPKRPLQEFWIAAAGPAVNIILGAGLFVAAIFFNGVTSDALWHMALVNGVLAAFNLIPGYPMDGGRMLRAALWWRLEDYRRASLIAARGGEWVGLGLVGLGVLGIFGIVPFFGFFAVIVGGFLWLLARLERLRAQFLMGSGGPGGQDLSGDRLAELLRQQMHQRGGGGDFPPFGSPPGGGAPPPSGELGRGEVEVIVRDDDGRETKYRQ